MNLRTLILPGLVILVAAASFGILNFVGQRQGPDQMPLQAAEIETAPEAQEEALTFEEEVAQLADEPQPTPEPEAAEEVVVVEGEEAASVDEGVVPEAPATVTVEPTDEATVEPTAEEVEAAPVAPVTPEGPAVAEVAPTREEEDVTAVVIEDEASGTTEILVEEAGDATPIIDETESVAILDETPVEAAPETPTETSAEAVEEAPLGLIIELSELSELEQPRFGRTTIENSGDVSIIRGQGVPGTRLELLVNDRQAAETFVDPNGNWSLYESGLLPAGLQILSLRTSLADGRIGLSDETVSVLVDPDKGPGEAQLAVLGDGDGVRAFLSGPRFVREIVPQMVIVEGDILRVVGKAPAGSEVRLALSGQEVGVDTLIGADGVWDLTLDKALGQAGTLIQWNPVTRTEEARQSIMIPDQAALASALTIGQQQVIFF